MKKHGASHGAAVLVCTVTSALLVDVAREHVPVVFKIIHALTGLVNDALGWRASDREVSILFYATLLACVWGIAFSFMHSDRPKKD